MTLEREREREVLYLTDVRYNGSKGKEPFIELLPSIPLRLYVLGYRRCGSIRRTGTIIVALRYRLIHYKTAPQNNFNMFISLHIKIEKKNGKLLNKKI